MKRAGILTLATATITVFTVSAYGQAIIGYGVNVGRAGAAGAASGAGAAGIFTGVRGALEQDDKKATQPRQATAREDEREAEDAATKAKKQPGDAQPAKWDVGQSETTSSGIVISGLHTPRRRPAVARASTVPSAPSGDPAAAAEATEQTTASPEPGEGSAPAIVVAKSKWTPSARGIAKPLPGTNAPEAATPDKGEPSHDILEIAPGTAIEDVMEALGKPLMALTGISGAGYTEKYVFRAADGARITVLALNGKVVSAMRRDPAGAQRTGL